VSRNCGQSIPDGRSGHARNALSVKTRFRPLKLRSREEISRRRDEGLRAHAKKSEGAVGGGGGGSNIGTEKREAEGARDGRRSRRWERSRRSRADDHSARSRRHLREGKNRSKNLSISFDSLSLSPDGDWNSIKIERFAQS